MTINAIDLPADVASILRPGKDEMNFAELPIALLTDRVPKGQKSIKFEDQIFDPKKKKMITRRRIIDGSDEYGLPTATDDAVILALIQLTKHKSDFNRRDVEFTRLELIGLLGWADEGRNYERLKLSLIRIANVTYNYENAWWDNRQKTWVTKVFHILDTVEINDSRVSGRQKCLFPSRIVWNEVVFDSFQASFLRDIDFQLCIKLEHPTALRMYRFLGKRFHVRPDWSFDLKEFAHDYMCLGKNYEGGTQIARKLQPAINELEALGFLEPLTPAERFQKRGREWTVRFVQKASALPPPAMSEATPTANDALPLIRQLIERGVTPKTASELVTAKPAALIERQLDVFDWLKGQKNNGLEKPAGFLVKSILDEYAVPPDYVTKAARTQLAEQARQAEEVKAANRQKRLREDAETKAERLAITTYRQRLTADQLTRLESEAIAQADQEKRDSLATTTDRTIRQFQINIITDLHITRLLQQQPADA